MALIVVAKFNPKPGAGPDIIEAFRQVIPLVHEEQGCELYAAHLENGGDTVIIVERWATREALDAHALGQPLALLNDLTGNLVTRPYDVWITDAVPLGGPQGVL